MSKNSKSILFLMIIALISVTSKAADSQKNGNPCLSGICVGDDITTHKSINWVALRKEVSDDVEIENAKRIIAPQPPAIMREVANTIYKGIFDASRLASLAKIKGFCHEQQFQGRFVSESGFLTIVTAEAYPSAPDGSTQIIRVKDIERSFPEGYSNEQVKQLHGQLRQQYAGIVEAAFDEHKPFWQFDDFHHSLMLTAAYQYKDQENLLKKYPACVQAVNVN